MFQRFIRAKHQARFAFDAAMMQLLTALRWHVDPDMLRDHMRRMQFRYREGVRAENVMDYESATVYYEEVIEMAEDALLQLDQSQY